MSQTSLELLYGKSRLPVVLPEDVSVKLIAKPHMPVLRNPSEAVAEALREGSNSLDQAAQGARTACIVICDITRPVPNGLLLPPMIQTLLDAGLAKENITVLVATGLHRPNLDEELRELVGSDWVLDTVRVENHFAKNSEDQAFLAKTKRGTPVGINRRFVEADLKIVTGLVEPHFMAGYSGGRKVIAPGIAHEDTIRTFHNTDFMEHPLTTSCQIEGNPLHNEQLEILKMLGTVYAVNTVLDDERRLSFVNFGEVLESHAAAVAFVRKYAEVSVPKRYPVVITSAAGYPLDKTFYQTIKGIVTASGALEKDGILLIASENSEGMGSEEFIEAQSRLVEIGLEQYLEEARTRPLANIDEWQTVKLSNALKQGQVHLYSPNLTELERHQTGLKCHSDWNEAVAQVLAETKATEVAVIPEGPYVIPIAP